ncbi:HD domain-containing protein [Kribbella qitaiheensis]|nr:HD domain-containing protein [Kribbella qitaiheensis]
MLVFELGREAARLMPESSELITSAAAMASFLHRRQTRFVRGRLPWVPYVEHPLRVALRLMRWGVRDPEVVAAALLHDVVEDCSGELLSVFGCQGETTLCCLARLYGDGTAEYVHQVTNPDAVVDLESYQIHVTALAWSRTPAVLIKASDLKDNAGSIPYQLGYGEDERMLRLLRKYLPCVREIAGALSAMGLETASEFSWSAAAADLCRLTTELEELAGEHNIVV